MRKKHSNHPALEINTDCSKDEDKVAAAAVTYKKFPDKVTIFQSKQRQINLRMMETLLAGKLHEYPRKRE